MNELLDALQQAWAIRALVASSFVGLMCGVLGCFIVLRNMSLIGDALSHAILPGVVVAYVVVGYNAMGFFVGAVLAGLLTAGGITWLQHKTRTKNDAAVGIVFTAMFALGVMGISWISRSQGVHLDLKDFLFGNVLGVSDTDLYLTSIVTAYVLFCVVVFYRYLFVSSFQAVIAQVMGISVQLVHYFLMMLLSFAVVASLQTVGVILVVAMLITPASAALLLSNRLQVVLVLAGGIGILSAVSGLVLAILIETAPGPAMAVMATFIYALAVVFSPNKGLLQKWRRERSQVRRIEQEDLVKVAWRLRDSGQLTPDNLLEQSGMSRLTFIRRVRQLRHRQLIEKDGMVLTQAGLQLGQKLVRNHRLWETYLHLKTGLSPEQVHDEAEQYEHHLTDQLVDDLEASLGFPKFDPHGSPIPEKI